MSSPPSQIEALKHALRVMDAPLALASTSLLNDLREDLTTRGILQAVANHDNGPIFDWLATLLPLQGISDRSAYAFAAKHREVRMSELDHALAASTTSCPRLSSYWAFGGCGHRILADTCSEPRHRPRCPVPKIPARNGRLAQALVSLRLFIRDACDNDLVGWIDRRLAGGDVGVDMPSRGRLMRDAVLEPLTNVHGVSDKVVSLALADLLLGGDPGRERWTTAGSSFVVVDSLVHQFLHRTGVLDACDARHPYGPACYAPGGCSEVVGRIAFGFDARTLNAAFPACFPRLITHAIWRFCADGHWDICNGRRIDDRTRCRVEFCPVTGCARVSLRR